MGPLLHFLLTGIVILTRTVRSVLHENVKQIAMEYFRDDFIQIFSDRFHEEPTERQLLGKSAVDPATEIPKWLMEESRWSITQVDYTTTQLLPDEDQTKNPKVGNIVIILEKQGQLEKVTAVLRQSRILGYQSKVLVVCKLPPAQIKEVLIKLWEVLRAINVAVLSSANNSTRAFTWSPYEKSRSPYRRKCLNVPQQNTARF